MQPSAEERTTVKERVCVVGTGRLDAVTAACHALVIATDHSCFRDLGRIRRSMKASILIDGRNLLEPRKRLARGSHTQASAGPAEGTEERCW